ncbi:MAG: hypothetical protein UY26_C0003G0016 [Candidatus Jorgensenbacteria bacterium GW2011_GWA1_48_13]|uniref:Uncharacterized protein n=1 Tax=Candidatus Jorgensenbacteria bacterium GW2011_GWB1_50_10 TaxID=1618665 RepID=A0A0G1YJ07_9BACT|nr:MAG: hypothetical protein UY26_C0003G0016 [Candidatus Jorgensenbacteria bacterium GW2011_GWA1_48_13]KKW14977.1 MAG: hypothetical protein UY55_C0002G0033 [Candidatus Jorgensenbacteria bacterium GW2011_GWB1_50_10]
MDKNDILMKIKEALEKMGCTNIIFPNPKDDFIVATFDCKEVTSFVADIPGWTYSGIHLDPSKERQYKIDFIKIETTS